MGIITFRISVMVKHKHVVLPVTLRVESMNHDDIEDIAHQREVAGMQLPFFKSVGAVEAYHHLEGLKGNHYICFQNTDIL